MPSPQVSIVICTYNREKYIADALQSVLLQDAAQELFELVVVDNRSTDRSGAIIQDFITQNPGRPYRYHFEEQQGLSHARNAGIRLSQGEIIAFIDDDAIARPDFVRNLIEFFRTYPQAAAVGGKVIPKFTEGEPEWLSKYVRKVVSEIDFGQRVHALTGKRYPFGANMSVRADMFRKYGQFNPDLGRKGQSLLGGEEKDLFDRLRNSGHAIYYDPELVVEHIIDPYRLTEDYLRRFCRGVGISERIRLKQKGPLAKMMKWGENKIKRAGSLVLGALYTAKGKPAQGRMIMDVMRWIEEGYSGKYDTNS